MRRFALLLALAAPAPAAAAQNIVISPAPARVAVTVYRNPDRGLDQINLNWLGGYALVSETRRVRLPAGTSELRFEGVTAGLVPQSAIVTGLGDAVLEKNRDARLLSPGSLLSAYVGQRLFIRRTSKETGAVREQEAVVRSTADGVVVQTEGGIEALRCTGLPETLLAPRVPADLSAKPTLSVRVRSPRPIERDVTLSYITNNFDWQADYIADLAADGRTLRLFGWLTLANGDETGLSNAATQAVAGKLNRERIWVTRGEAPPIAIQCWPQRTTSDIPEATPVPVVSAEDIVVTGSRMMAPPPAPPPPPPMAERGGMAEEETLGDVRLYRIPIAVTVAARSQKQVALLQQPTVKVEETMRLRVHEGAIDTALERILVTRNLRSEGLGLALPAGRVALFATRHGRRILVGEGRIDDCTVGEKVEIAVGPVPGLRAQQLPFASEGGGGMQLTLTNDSRAPHNAEIELPENARAVSGGEIVRRDGKWLWIVRIPANGRAALRYRIARG